MANKVLFGLSNVHYAVFNDTTHTYGTPAAFPGAVNLSLSAEGDESKFYADNVVYYVTSTNSGMSGSVEMAMMPDAFATTVLGHVKDETTGLTYEPTDAVPKTVALLFQVEGDDKPRYGVLYNVTFSRPGEDAETKTESTEPKTITLNLTAIGRDFTIGTGDNATVKNIIRAHADYGDAAYTNFFTAVQAPGTPTAPASS